MLRQAVVTIERRRRRWTATHAGATEEKVGALDARRLSRQKAASVGSAEAEVGVLDARRLSRWTAARVGAAEGEVSGCAGDVKEGIGEQEVGDDTRFGVHDMSCKAEIRN